jgi:[ribosomal protein S5]-alanine N-acetyltransferase
MVPISTDSKLQFSAPSCRLIASPSMCRIRTWQRKDIDSVFAHLNDRTMWEFLAAPFPESFDRSAAERYLAVGVDRPDLFFFTIALPDSDEAVGAISGQMGTGVHARSVELGVWLARPYWRSGIAREAATAFTDWLFDRHNTVRVHALIFRSNLAAVGGLRASGFTAEGRLRCSVFKDGRIMDQMQYAKINPRFAAGT